MAGKPRVQIYTDGACSGNPGPGGYGAILIYGGHTRELSGGYRLTTNNRMELMAIIKSLEALKKPCQVDLYSDSRYVVDALKKGWIKSWIKNSWKKSDGDPVKNPDLWQRILDLASRHEIQWFWVRGHAGDPVSLEDGMNGFLEIMEVTFRRDPDTKRPRVNKPDSRLDREQKQSGRYYYSQ
jgi:ribonuclease HI